MTKNLYLYYYLIIEPLKDIDIKIEQLELEAYNIKKNIKLDEIISTKNVLLNEDAKELLKKKNRYLLSFEYSFIDTCYVNYIDVNHNVEILFYKINDYESYISNIKVNLNFLTLVHCTIKLENNLLSDLTKYYNQELKEIIKILTLEKKYNLNEINIEDLLQNKLYNYQKNNINWMLENEKNPVEEYITDDKLFFFPGETIYNYSLNIYINKNDRELVKFKGGVIMDDKNTGKTLQLLCLAMSNVNLNTIILVPEQLETHWISQWNKHFNISMPDFIKIVKFNELTKIQLDKFDRIIVDEFHELILNEKYNNILEICFKTGCKYKWCISTTPDTVPNLMYNLIKYLTEIDLYYTSLERYNYLFDTYTKILKKNALENIIKENNTLENVNN